MHKLQERRMPEFRIKSRKKDRKTKWYNQNEVIFCYIGVARKDRLRKLAKENGVPMTEAIRQMFDHCLGESKDD